MPRFVEDLAAFTEAFGPENAALVLPLSTVRWPNAEARDEFIAAMLGSVGEPK